MYFCGLPTLNLKGARTVSRMMYMVYTQDAERKDYPGDSWTMIFMAVRSS